ncbi:MAG: zinc-dependent metalloprotease, partial [Bacteroidaceae bacterium]|nr:zinc-dependent metalloprotease [Bacteroidaceae bacterium]
EDQLDRLGIFPRINDYDEWAIQWGYGPMAADNADDDHRLREEWVAGKLSDKRLWWGDGEISIGRLDPRNQTEDLGDNAMKASEYGIRNLTRQIVNLTQWTADNTGDLYDGDVPTMYDEMRLQFIRYCGHVARNIGGYYVTFQPKGTAEDVYEPVPAARQKEALAWLERHILNEPEWLRQVPYARRLTPNPQTLTAHAGESVVTAMMNRLEAMNENYTAEQYVSDLLKLIFAEADSRKAVSPYRVALQNTMILHLTRAYGNGYEPVRPAALMGLQQIQAKAKAASTSAPDATSRAHWASVYDKIGRVLVWK